MLALRCTQKLLNRMKVKPVDADAATTVLGDWYATYAILRRREVIICCAERSLLPVIVEARELSTLAQRLRDGAQALLHELGVPANSIACEIDAMKDVVFAKTNNRSIVGVLNNYVFLADERQENPRALALSLAHTPFFASSSRCLWPDKATLELFARAADVVH